MQQVQYIHLADCYGAIKATPSRVAESSALDFPSLIACYGVVNHQVNFRSAILPFVLSSKRPKAPMRAKSHHAVKLRGIRNGDQENDVLLNPITTRKTIFQRQWSVEER